MNEENLPNFYKLRETIDSNSKKYISLEMRNFTLELWEKSYVEIIREVKQLTMENEKLKEEVRNISINYAKVSKFKDKQGQGKKRSPKLLGNKDNILNWKKENISNREIAKKLGVSEGTIRHFLKSIKEK